MVKIINGLRNFGNRLRKFGQSVYNGGRTLVRKIGNGLRTGYQFTRDRIIPGVVSLYNNGRRFLGSFNRAVEAGSDAAGQIADAVGGRAGNVIRQGKEKFDRKYGQVRDKVEEIHKKGEDIYNRGRRVVDIGRNFVNTVKQNGG